MTTNLKKSADIIADLLETLENEVPEFYYQSELVAQANDLLKELDGEADEFKTFIVSGYWADDHSSINGYIIKESHEIDEENDDNIFFYGLSESDLQKSIKEKTPVEGFIITEYEVI